MSSERLQKILARAGLGSRRAAERLIADGRVRVNGRIVKELGTKADTVHDRVEVNGQRVVAEHPVYYLLHKPRAVVTTLADPEQRASVAELMKGVTERVFPVGRLDYHTSGALLMTNDGELAQALLHPRRKVPKVYVAKLRGSLSLGHLQALREGVVLDGDETTAKAEVFVLREEHGNTWLQLTITEGKNRQIHRMGEAIGRRVMRLSRASFAELSIDGLRPGEHRSLTDKELAKLKRDYLAPGRQGPFVPSPRRAQAPAIEVEEAPAPKHPQRPRRAPHPGTSPRRAKPVKAPSRTRHSSRPRKKRGSKNG
jgi:23S rRNA pseudouridine2605 synthase